MPLLDRLPDILTPVIATGRPWLEAYGVWAVAIGLFTETLLFTGVIVPGFGILVAAGFLSGAGLWSPAKVVALAWVGAAAGDQASYLLGLLCGERLFTARHQRLARRLAVALESEGRSLLLWYHYAPPLRAVLPCVAGLTRYHRGRWLLYDTLGVGLWVVVVWLIGYSAHAASSPGGNLALAAVNGMVTVLCVALIWRFTRRLRHCTEVAPARQE